MEGIFALIFIVMIYALFFNFFLIIAQIAIAIWIVCVVIKYSILGIKALINALRG